jgi:hypothetical protein
MLKSAHHLGLKAAKAYCVAKDRRYDARQRSLLTAGPRLPPRRPGLVPFGWSPGDAGRATGTLPDGGCLRLPHRAVLAGKRGEDQKASERR